MPVGWIPRISEKLGNKKGICRDKHPSGRHKQRFLLHWTLHPFTDTIGEENCGPAGENPERRSESDQVAWLNCSAEGKGGWDQDWSYDSSLPGGQWNLHCMIPFQKKVNKIYQIWIGSSCPCLEREGVTRGPLRALPEQFLSIYLCGIL